MYDEALAVFSRIDPARVVDPATCLFYEAVCQQQLLKKDGLGDARQAAAQHRRRGRTLPPGCDPDAGRAAIARRSIAVCVSRKMQDSERRLDLGRGGQRVQKVQEEIVESLNDIIKKKLEQQANPAAVAGPARREQQQSLDRAGRGFDASRGRPLPATSTRKMKKQGAWGNLQPKAVTEAKNLLKGIPLELPRCRRTILQEAGQDARPGQGTIRTRGKGVRT